MLPIIRNDDVSIDTDIEEIKTFCRLCDKYEFKIIQCITPIGHTIDINCNWSNSGIKEYGQNCFFIDNKQVYEYLLSRDDFIATHGARHTHRPSQLDQAVARYLLLDWGFNPEYATLPFNEVSPEYDREVLSMKVLGQMERLEDFLIGMPLHTQKPNDPIIYCHSWRFKDRNIFGYSWEKLDKCLAAISMMLT